jgi:RecA-family ATPase
MNNDLFNIKPFNQFMIGPTEIEWLVQGIIPVFTAGIMAGDSGVGKTWLVLYLALCIAVGIPWFGQFDVKQGSVVLVDFENHEILLRNRLMYMLKPLELSAIQEIPLFFLVGEPINLSPANKHGEDFGISISLEKLMRSVQTIEPNLVIFDSLTRFHSSNENSSNEMSEVFNNVKLFMQETNTACLFTHHTRKSNFGPKKDMIRGSTDIRAFFDYTFIIEGEK